MLHLNRNSPSHLLLSSHLPRAEQREKFRAIDVKKFRESEIKHARVAMLAFAGMFVQELAHPLFENGGKDIGPAIVHFQAVTNYFPLMPAILLIIVGIFEGNNIYGERWFFGECTRSLVVFKRGGRNTR